MIITLFHAFALECTFLRCHMIPGIPCWKLKICRLLCLILHSGAFFLLCGILRYFLLIYRYVGLCPRCNLQLESRDWYRVHGIYWDQLASQQNSSTTPL